MTAMFARPDQHDASGGYVVRRPRRTDALGASLRGAFENQDRLPEDIDRILRRLDHIG